MTFFNFRAIAQRILPSKRVECHDRRLKDAQELFERYQAVMSPPDRELAYSLLEL